MTSPLSHPKYRSDIDGLRAIAVISVVAFHAFPELVTGGFIGVDIFFVISGFLISTIIFENLENNSFSFREFYGRRIRRIFPALLTILTASYIFGWFTLFSAEYSQLSHHLVGGTVFLSNFFLLKESGYFDTDAEAKPLLHLWSLGIEEQFYIIWPLLLWIFWKLRINFLAMITLIIVLSFAFNIHTVKNGNLVEAFYLPQARFWELLIGSALSLQRRIMVGRQESCIPTFVGMTKSCLGIFLILFSIFFITKDFPFPSWWALLPTMGAALIISADNKSWFNHKILSNKVLVWFGLISYPLYLWHWPLLSFARIIMVEKPDVTQRIILVLVSILLAWLTHIFIEKPLRFGKYLQAKTAFLVMAMMLIGFVGILTFSGKGFLFRGFVVSNKISDKQLRWEYFKTKECSDMVGFDPWFCNITGNKDNIKTAIIGDSTANSLAFGLKEIYASKQDGVINLGMGFCHGTRGIEGNDNNRFKYTCSQTVDKTYNFIFNNDSIKTVIISFVGGNLPYWGIPEVSENSTATERFEKMLPYLIRILQI